MSIITPRPHPPSCENDNSPSHKSSTKMTTNASKPSEAGHIEDVVSCASSSSSTPEDAPVTPAAGVMPPPDERITGKLILAFIVSFRSSRNDNGKLTSGQALVFQVICYETTYYVSSPILSYVIADLGPGDPSATWIVNSWSLCAALVVSIAGRLGDIFGRRYFMLCGSALACIGAISELGPKIDLPQLIFLAVGATGQSIGQMIVSGVFFGLSAGILENYYACLMELVPYKKRTFFIGKDSFMFDWVVSILIHSRRSRCHSRLPMSAVPNHRLGDFGPSWLARLLLVHLWSISSGLPAAVLLLSSTHI